MMTINFKFMNFIFNLYFSNYRNLLRVNINLCIEVSSKFIIVYSYNSICNIINNSTAGFKLFV